MITKLDRSPHECIFSPPFAPCLRRKPPVEINSLFTYYIYCEDIHVSQESAEQDQNTAHVKKELVPTEE